MMGYYKMPEETKETLVNGYLKTGDLGYIDEDNYLYIIISHFRRFSLRQGY